jgi:hypothetical protein
MAIRESTDLWCGRYAEPAELVADATPYKADKTPDFCTVSINSVPFHPTPRSRPSLSAVVNIHGSTPPSNVHLYSDVQSQRALDF